MKNKLVDLNNHLFAQLERLSDEDTRGDELEAEIKRAEAVVAVADQITKGTDLQLKAVKMLADHGYHFQPQVLSLLEHKPLDA